MAMTSVQAIDWAEKQAAAQVAWFRATGKESDAILEAYRAGFKAGHRTAFALARLHGVETEKQERRRIGK